MTAMTRLVAAIAVVTVASLACGSPGAAASEQKELDALANLLKGLVAKQIFTGTVVVSDSASGSSSRRDVIETSSSSTSLNHNVVFTLTPGSIVAKITYDEKTRVDSKLDYQAHTVTGTKTTETTASGTHSDPASVSVNLDLRSDDTYQINFQTSGVEGVYKMTDTATTVCKNLEGSTCRPSSSTNSDEGKPPNQGGLAGSVDGRIDRSRPNVLAGSVSEARTLNDGSTGRRTVTWNLSRK